MIGDRCALFLSLAVALIAVITPETVHAAEEPAQNPAAAQSQNSQPQKENAMSVIGDQMNVELDYTLTVDGEVVDSTQGKQPFNYVHGRGQIIPGLEKQLVGMGVGQSRKITVAPGEGYGETDPSAVVEISRTQLPEGVEPEVGMMLRGTSPEGQPVQARIAEVKGETVKVDLNHPLAGKTLNFDVTVRNVAPTS